MDIEVELHEAVMAVGKDLDDFVTGSPSTLAWNQWSDGISATLHAARSCDTSKLFWATGELMRRRDQMLEYAPNPLGATIGVEESVRFWKNMAKATAVMHDYVTLALNESCGCKMK